MGEQQSSVRRRGFSLIELLIAMLIGVILGTALVRIVLTQSAFVQVQRLSSESRMVAASGLGLLQSELRSIEVRRDLSSSLITATESVLEFRMPTALGVLCDASTAMVQPYDTARMVMAGFSRADFGGYAIRQTTWAYTYRDAAAANWVTPVAVSVACTNAPRINQLAGHTPMTFATLPVPGYVGAMRGTPILFWNRARYRFGASTTFAGRRALYRVLEAPGRRDSIEFVAPLDTGARFRYFDVSNVDIPRPTPPTLLRIIGVQVSLPGLSQTSAPRRAPEATRLAASVFFRNSQ